MAGNLVTHRFFCVNCGKEGIPMPRKRGHQHGKLHRKKCFCLTCKQCINHVECKDDEDVAEFKRAFEAGEYIEEAKESMAMAEPMTGFMKGE